MLLINFSALGVRLLAKGLEIGLCALQVRDSRRQVCIGAVDGLDEEFGLLKLAFDFTCQVRDHPHVQDFAALHESVDRLRVLVAERCHLSRSGDQTSVGAPDAAACG